MIKSSILYTFKKSHILLAATLVLLAGHASSAAPANFLSALQEAAYQHPQVQAASREWDGATSDKSSARWQRFPTPSIQSLTPQGGNKSSAVNRLVVEQPLFAGGRIDAGIDAADARERASYARYEQTAQDIAIRLSNTWYEWQRNKQRQTVLTESVEAHSKLKEQIERRVAEGVNPESDLTLAIARLSQTQAELSQARSAVNSARNQLAQLAGKQLDAFLKMPMRLAEQPTMDPPAENWKSLAQARDPLLTKLSAEITAASADVRVKRGQALPAVSLRYENDFSGQQQGSRVFVQVTAQPGAGLAAADGISSAAARRDYAEESLRAASIELVLALENDFSEYEAAQERLAVSNMLLQSTKKVAESYTRQFVAGRKNWLDVLNAVREATSARLSIFDTKALLGQAWWRLRLRSQGFAPTYGAVE